jgi:hypothetical protein
MRSSPFASLVTLPTIIDAPGVYLTRGGAEVIIHTVTTRHSFGCVGTYADGIEDGWHKSGRVLCTLKTSIDIISKRNV